MKEKKRRPPKPDGVEANPRFKARNKAGKRPRHSRVGERRYAALFDRVKASDDATTAIVASNILENQLAVTIMSRLRHLSTADHNRIFDGEAAALNRFHAKIQIGYALNLYDKAEYDELMLIKMIRNRFAHFLNVRSFNNPLVKPSCAKLLGAAHGEYLHFHVGPPDEAEISGRTARGAYLHAVAGMRAMLSLKGEKPKRPRPVLAYLGLSAPEFQSWRQKRGLPLPLRTRSRG